MLVGPADVAGDRCLLGGAGRAVAGPGRPEPELIEPGRPAWHAGTLHNAANPAHLARRHLRPDERWLAYKIAWVGGCVLYDRAVLDAVGGFDFWPDLPPAHCGEDVLVRHRVLARAGGAGILPSGQVRVSRWD